MSVRHLVQYLELWFWSSWIPWGAWSCRQSSQQWISPFESGKSRRNRYGEKKMVFFQGSLLAEHNRPCSGMLGAIHSYSAHSAWTPANEEGKQLLQLHGSPRTEAQGLSLKRWDIIPSDLVQKPIAHVGNIAWTMGICKASPSYVE